MSVMRQPRKEATHTPEAIAPARHAVAKSKLPWRGFCAGLLLIPINSLWIARTEGLDSAGWPTCISLFYNVIFSLLALLLLNVLLRRYLPRFSLSQPELLIVYGMVATGSSLAGRDCLQILTATIPHARYFATPENRWAEMIVPHLPKWLTIHTATEAVKHYENGHSTLYAWKHLRVWLVPIAVWGLFLLANIVCMLSVCVILRKQWVENERLAYPIVQIPLLITEEGGANALFRSKLLWGGVAISAGINLLNGFAYLYPSLPSIPVTYSVISFSTFPWNALNNVAPLIQAYYPCIIGMSYFMPTKMAFSSVFFYFLRKAMQVGGAVLGYQDVEPWFPYLREQAYGAWFTLFLVSLWLGRGYLKAVWRAAISQRGQTHDGGVGYRGAFLALGASIAVMVGFLIVMGIPLLLAALYTILLLLLWGAVTRVRAELGPPVHEMFFMGATQLITVGMGTVALGPKTTTLFALLWFQNRCHRGLLMPQQAESLKAASAGGVRIRMMVLALIVAGAVGILAGFWAHLHVAYHRSYVAPEHPAAPGSGVAMTLFEDLMSKLSSPTKPSPTSLTAVGVGATFTLALAYLNARFFSFPLHQAGYALGLVAMDYIWIPVLMSWALKVFILRYYGLRGFRAGTPFFAGLVIGEFAVGGFWNFMRGVLGVQTYTFFN